jgi:hypothetical protein
VSMTLSFPRPVDGSVDIFTDADVAVVKAHRPFDLETDERVDITGTLRSEDFARVVADATATAGPHTIELEHDRLTLERQGERFLFDLSRVGARPKCLMLEFPLEYLHTLGERATRSDA